VIPALLALSSCAPDGAAPPVEIVEKVTEVAPSGGQISALLVDLTGPIPSARIDGLELAQSWGVQPGRGYGLWDLPRDLALGPHTVSFVGAGGGEQLVSMTVGPSWFEEVSDRTGLVFEHQTEGWPAPCARSLTGVGVADVDLDGDLDVLVGNLTAASVLFEDLGDVDGDGLPDYAPATKKWSFGAHDLVASVSFADYDNDGDPDVFLGRRGPNRLLENRVIPDGATSFVDVTVPMGLAQADQRTTGGAWGDYDGDGDLDLYEINHVWCFPTANPDAPLKAEDHLYRNDGAWFTDVTALLPDGQRQVSQRFGFAGIWADYDLDGDQDLYVVNDAAQQGGRNAMFRNDGVLDGEQVFTDATDEMSAAGNDPAGKRANAMGLALGDVNGDGRPDLAYTNIGFNFLLASNPDGTWADASSTLGVQRPLLPWGDVSVTWGVNLFDVDDDGDLDLFLVGGALDADEAQPSALFVRDGHAMVDVTWEAGMGSPLHGKSSAQLDLDGDGWLDLLVANWSDRLEVWHNVLGRRFERHWLVVDPIGDGVAVNRDGFGSRVEVERLDGTVATCFRNPMPSMSGTGDPGCHFGLGGDAAVARVTVLWPDGVRQDVPPPAVDERIRVVRGAD
jgi:hypothetical protein